MYQANLCATTARSRTRTLTAPKGPPLPNLLPLYSIYHK